MVTLDEIKQQHDVKVYICSSFEYLRRIGFTEHGLRHAELISRRSRYVLNELKYPARDCELAAISGYLHDIGNVINRDHHGHASAMIAFHILNRLNMPAEEIALVLSAIGNHEEERGHAVNHIAAALILADKSDVDRSRVQNTEIATFDIHDRVNFAAQQSHLEINQERGTVALKLNIDVKICPVMEYFEIFLERMMMCRKAAVCLNLIFTLFINDHQLL